MNNQHFTFISALWKTGQTGKAIADTSGDALVAETVVIKRRCFIIYY